MVDANKNDLQNRSRLKFRHLLMYSLIFVTVPILTFLIGKWIDQTMNLPRFPQFPLNLIAGSAVFVIGLSIGIKSTRLLLKIGRGLPWGELNGQSQTSRLVTTGLYAYIRNPVTLGYSLLPCGMGLMFQSIGMATVIPVTALIVASTWAKAYEEPRLEKRFGGAYREYKQKTPFIIPHPKPFVSALITSISTIVLSQNGQSDKFKRFKIQTLFLNAILLLGLGIIPALVFYSEKAEAVTTKHVAIPAFIAICIMGAAAGLIPSKCSRLLHSNKKEGINSRAGKTVGAGSNSVAFRGHHPTCGRFRAHVFNVGSKTYCAGCISLVAGAILATGASLVYLLDLIDIKNAALLVFWIGFVGVLLGLIQYVGPLMSRVSIHMFLNVAFVLGAFFLLAGVVEINGEIAVELYTLALILYWILGRIVLSQVEHRKKCATCDSPSCGFALA